MNYYLYILCFSYIFIGAIFYTLASYYHLKMDKDWSFLKALIIAIPFVFLEYSFALHGIYYSYKYLNLSPSQILIVTTCFCFICIWLFNYFIMKIQINKKQMVNEIISFIFIMIAFFMSNVIQV